MKKPSALLPCFACAFLSLAASLKAEVIINEFMAVNDSTLQDEDGDYSDWIEIQNTGEAPLNLAGWHLTDTAGDLAKWAFPAVSLDAGAYLVVFASDKDRTDPNSELHTNFKLDGGGEYLALVEPDGITVADDFAPSYPDQAGDQAFGVVRETVKLIPEGADGRYLVPSNGSLGQTWTGGQAFDDGAWESGQGSLGFDHGEGGYFSLFISDVNALMFGVRESVYLRIPFTVPEGLDIESVRLQLQYDDGFVAYLNGAEIGSANAPASPAWDAMATAPNLDAAAILPETFPVAGGAATLQVGTNILAVHGLNHQPYDADPDFLLVPELEAVNRVRTFLDTPTPDDANSSGSLLEKVGFSPGRGFYDAPFEVTLSTDVVNADIRYTTDFSEPNENSTLYTGPIAVSSTAVIRAAAFKEGYQPSPMATHSYIFHADVLDQPSSPPGWPSTWGSRNAEYQMRSNEVNAHSEQAFVGFLRSMPSLMIVSSMENLFDDDDGIYDHPTSRGLAWERSGSVEWIHGDGTSGFGENCGVRIQGGLGGGGRSYKKKSWRLLFKSIYGPSKLRFPFFAWDPNATQSFDQLILRAGGNDRQDYTRDEFTRRCQIAMGEPGSHGIHVHVYLNGLYWGMYNAVERPAGDFAASYFGGDKEDYDALAHNRNNVIDGDNQAWNAMTSLSGRGVSGRDRYMELIGRNPDGTNNPAYPHYVDLDNLVVYMLANIYLGMGDWPGHNWYAARPRGPESDGYKFFVWDGEGAFRNNDVTGVGNGAAETYGDLRANAEFNLLFADHAQKHLFNDGALTPANARDRFSVLSDSVEPGVIPERARWGHVSLSSWQGRRDSKMNYLQNRRDTVVGYLRNARLYPMTDAPAFNQHGGDVGAGFTLTMTAPDGAEIYYTFDGSDPREPWTNNALGVLYGGPLPVDYNLRVRARARDASGNWSGLTEALFVVPADSPLRVSEVMFHPRAPSGAEIGTGFSAGDFEFVEIENTGFETVGLAGLRLSDGISFDFSHGSVHALEPGEAVVVVRNLEAFQLRYPNANAMKIAGEFAGALDNNGDAVSLLGASGEVIWAFAFNDARGWPAAADGAGHSLVPLQFGQQPDGILNHGGNWRASAFIDGSPGSSDSVPIRDVVLNEIVAHTDANQPPYDSNDVIELFNRTGTSVSLEDWYLSDDATDLGKWHITGAHTVPGNGWIAFDEVTGFHNPITEGFGMDKSGERVFLSHLPGTGGDRVADVIRFKGQENGRSLGRHPDGSSCLYAMAPTTGAANSSPVEDLIISEIMYDPQTTAQFPDENSNDEYIKISNVTPAPVPLWNADGEWRLDGVDFDFPPNTTVPAGESILVVSFDPITDATALAEFNAAYGLANGAVTLFGPYEGKLSNRGERIALKRPQAPDPPDTQPSWVIVDEVIYFHQSPWPSGANKSGHAIVRLNPMLCGSFPFNWDLGAAGGSPDANDAVLTQPAMAVFPQALEITTPENVNVSARQFTIRNVGIGMMDYSVADDVDWLDVQPASGQVAEGDELELTVAFSVTTLPTGAHTGTVTLSSANATNAPRSFSVDLGVIDRDKTPPTLESADPMGNPNQIVCTFSEPLESSGAENPANCGVSDGITVTGASLSPEGTVLTLSTSTMADGASYTLTVNNILDRAIIPNPILPNTQLGFTYVYTAPLADAGTGGAAVANATVMLDATASADPDGGPQPLSHVWTQIHGPPTDITNASQAAASAALPTKGTYVFRVSVSDGITADADAVVFLVSETVSLFSSGQTWRYLDTGTDLGTAWRAVDFDDDGWSSGPAQLGYGDGDETTVVSFGPESGNKFRTTYFRTEFVATNTAEIGSLAFHVLRDDGAVIYLNGNEVVRSNMRPGAVDFDTTAESVVGGGSEDTFFMHPAPADNLVEGTNVLAAEVHQISGSSSDISFDLSLDTEVVEIDEDGDAMPDYWEVLALGGTGRDGNRDIDGDGRSDLEEFLAGTDPTDPDSFLALTITDLGAGEVELRYDTVPVTDAVLSPTARFYTLETSGDGSDGSWQPVQGHAARLGDGSTASYLHAAGNGAALFRVRVWVE